MARVQVLPLTTETIGDITQTPFVLVFDGEGVSDLISLALSDEIRGATGATMVLVSETAVDVANPLQLSEEHAEALLAHLMGTHSHKHD